MTTDKLWNEFKENRPDTGFSLQYKILFVVD